MGSLCGIFHENSENSLHKDSLTAVTFQNLIFEDADGNRLGTPLVVKDHVITTRCRYKEEYDVILTFGENTISHEDVSETTGGLSFNFQAYDDPAYAQILEEPVTGEMVFVELKANNPENAVGVNYSFSKCGFEDEITKKYVTLFNAETGDGCHSELIPGLDFNGVRELKRGIGFEYRMFGTSQRTKGNYQLQCKIKVCLIGESGICDNLRNTCSLGSTIVTLNTLPDVRSMRM